MSRIAVYAGSFDPPTHGHEDVIKRASDLFPRVHVAIGHNASKQPMFTLDERLNMLKDLTLPLPNVSVVWFEGLLAHYCRSLDGAVIVRGLRATMDFEYEMQIAHANAVMGVESIFLPTKAAQSFISSSLVKELARNGGEIAPYCDLKVVTTVMAKIKGIRI